jgi:hypothetical protein
MGLDGPRADGSECQRERDPGRLQAGHGRLGRGPPAGRPAAAGGARLGRDPRRPPVRGGLAPGPRGERDQGPRGRRDRLPAADARGPDRDRHGRARGQRPLGRGGPRAARGRRRGATRAHRRVRLRALRPGRHPEDGREVRVPRRDDQAARRARGGGRGRGGRGGPQHRAPRGRHQELARQPQGRGLPARGARVPGHLVRRAGLARPRPRARRRGSRPVHVVVVARAGVRQRLRLADRLPAGDAVARRPGADGGGRPGRHVRRAVQRPRPGGRHLRRRPGAAAPGAARRAPRA